ncbi:type II toxin-antitoxin system RelE/ParE family toxin [Crocosphaera sp. XPORK-15E]|uniref:type II toxin-antitoxin system RelE/ParE family toxin n=1 Tax=Crocosphaera sp. XPORK-15E TaxID=3110247 RepID=UPI002B21BB3A|nr:type II toxin-antitoxin system RelE/ParE family toxin [Crocosphaera sp. XPORK-15E]MEA5535078.1 type II toxin-antitoxin system RelE/ParE family toxin [Crocosphaera sp. XPORK-15E]
MKSIIIHDKAKQELDHAISYYEKQKQGLGLDFLSEVEKALEKVRINPNIGSPYSIKDLRYYVIRRFPFKIFYTEFEGLIWIIAIAHAKRKPNYWKKRTLDD